jgi:hypothetical protein
MADAIRTGLDELGNAIHTGIDDVENATHTGQNNTTNQQPTDPQQAVAPVTTTPDDCGPIHCEDEPAPAQS